MMHSIKRTGGATILCAGLLMATGCDRGSSTEGAAGVEPKAAVDAPQAAAPTNSPAADVAKKTLPREKKAAETEKFGELPEGVGLAVGSAIPDVSARDLEGRPVKLRALTDKGPLLLIFYRGGWCPYCSFQVHDIARRAADFEALGVTPVLISVDQPGEAAKLEASYEVSFPVLSDSSLEVHGAFSVLNELDGETMAMLAKHGHDIEAASGQTHHTIAIPSAFILDEGKVVFAHAEVDYKKRPSSKQLLAQLEAMGYGKK